MNVIELNVGGIVYSTTLATLTKDRTSSVGLYFYTHCVVAPPRKPPDDERLAEFSEAVVKLGENRFFIDRDGALFRHVLDFLRTGRVFLPERFKEMGRLREEVQFYSIKPLLQQLNSMTFTDVVVNGGALHGETSGTSSGFITVGYRGTFQFGRDGQADIKFRKIHRILVCGKFHLCKEVFGDTLNESRDPAGTGFGRYTARLYLKHTFLEQAFDMLSDAGFKFLSACASGTSAGPDIIRDGTATEEQRWNHFNEFVFYREPLECV